jgi:hypothetical protein
VDHLPVGVILVDEQARLLRTNHAADEILRQGNGLRANHGTLRAESSSANSVLLRLTREAARTTSGDGLGSGGALRVPRTEDEHPLDLLVTPLPQASISDWSTRGVAAVFVSDTDRTSAPPTDVLEPGVHPCRRLLSSSASRGTRHAFI